MCLLFIRPEAIRVSKFSFFAPARTGAIGHIFQRPTVRSRRMKCSVPFLHSFTTTSLRRDSFLSRTNSRERALLAEALSAKSGHKVEVSKPARGERKELVQHALANAREALARKLADTSSQQKLLGAMTESFLVAAKTAPYRSL